MKTILILLCLLFASPGWSAITFFGTASTPTDNTAQDGLTSPRVVTPPGSMLANDYVILIASHVAPTGGDALSIQKPGGKPGLL